MGRMLTTSIIIVVNLFIDAKIYCKIKELCGFYLRFNKLSVVFNNIPTVLEMGLQLVTEVLKLMDGTQVIDCVSKKAGISLGNNKFSYYEIKDGYVYLIA